MRLTKTFALSILALLLISGSVFAQGSSTQGSLNGQVLDENGAPLPGVLVTATGAAGTKSATTDGDGSFLFPYLSPGMYDVKAELSGFTTVEQLEVPVRLGLRSELVFKMKAGVEELVVVTESAPTVDVQSTTTGANINSELLSSIPVGRSFAAAIELAPGVSDSGIGGGNLSISGASGLENTYIIDGVNITDPGYGAVGSYSIRFGSLGTGFNADMVKEIQVKSGGFEPEYGQALGGVVNVITKSGGNEFAGDAYAYFTPGSLEGDRELRDYSANTVTNVGEDESIDGGINIGGPIVRDRLFFFGAYNPRRQERILLNDPQAPAFNAFPEATRTRTTQAYNIKATANATANHTIEFSAFGDPSEGELGFQNANGLLATRPEIQVSSLEYGSNSQTGRWTGILRPNMFAEAQVARAHNEFEEILGPQGNQYLLDDRSGPVRIIRGGLGFFDAGSVGNNIQYGFKMTNIWRDHEIRYGVQYEDIDYSGGANYSGPTYTAFNGQQTTTGASVRILSGAAVGLPHLNQVFFVVRNRLTPSPVPTTTSYLNGFVQDSWNITPQLNVKFGVRYETQELSGDVEGSETIKLENNWAPRIGASYDYLNNGKSKVYFHYGRFFEKVPNDLAVRALVAEVQTNGLYYDAALAHPIPGTGQIIGGHATEVEGLTSESTSSFETKAQYSNEWLVGAEQEVFEGLSLGARFIHRDVARVIEDIQINLSAPCVPYEFSATGCAQPGMTAESYLTSSSAYFITNMDGHYPGFPEMTRDYNALEVTFEKRMAENWQILGSYRFAKLEGNYEGLFRRDNGQSDPNITSLGDFAAEECTPAGCTPSQYIGFTFDEGPLPNDVKHNFKLFGSYQWAMGLNTGVGLNFNTGTPINNLGAIPIYGDSERVVEPRGSRGRTDNIMTFDVHADWGMDLGPGRFAFGIDVFNLFNSQNIVEVRQDSEIDNFTLNPLPQPDFLRPLLFQDPRTVRSGRHLLCQ